MTNDSIGIEGSDFQFILDIWLVSLCNPSLSHSRIINNLDLQINHKLAGCVSTGYSLDSGKQVFKVLTFKNGKQQHIGETMMYESAFHFHLMRLILEVPFNVSF